MSQEYWNKIHIEKYSKADWSKKPSIFATQAVKFFPESGKLLDIGTGQGGDADYFQSRGYEVVATDYSQDAINNAKGRVKNVNFINLDTSQGLPFENESFDIVYSHPALHYFDTETTKKVFEDIHRILKPRGIFATITNTIDDPELKQEIPSIQLEPDYYEYPGLLNKRYFSVESMQSFTQGLFEPLLADNQGETHKDEIKTLIRFIGKKI